IEIKYNFTSSRKFMEDAPILDFDICFLDISMPAVDGLLLAQKLNKKPFIFITGSENRLKEALSLEPIDIVTKPFNKNRLDHAIERAFELIGEKIENVLFNVAESKSKVKIHLPDILYVNTDEIDPRHKTVVLRDGTTYTIMNSSMEELLYIARHLVQVNRRELISIDLVNQVEHDLVSVKYSGPAKIPLELTIGNSYKNEMRKRIFY